MIMTREKKEIINIRNAKDDMSFITDPTNIKKIWGRIPSRAQAKCS